jgi:aminoglycoside/choline kinase family phosphotransferase
MNSIYHPLVALYRTWSGDGPDTVIPLPGAGSSRRYFRMSSPGRSAIGVFHPDHRENKAFIAFTRHFLTHGLPVPDIYTWDPEKDVYLIEDLGYRSLYDLLREQKEDNRFPEEVVSLFREVIHILVRFQVVAGKDLDYSLCYPKAVFDRQAMLWDLNYFKYYFLRLTSVSFDEQKLDDDFDRLAAFLSEADGDFFQYRDFQSRNIMITGRGPYFIDYQGGRKGALQYDLASLLFQAKAEMPQKIRDELLDDYLDVLSTFIPVDRKTFIEFYHGYLLIRLLQVFGAYGRRGLIEHKPHFLQSIPYAVKNLRWFTGHVQLPVQLSELYYVLEQIIGLPAWQSPDEIKNDFLHVHVNSFAFPKGIPEDLSGHGGGFVFDCRILPNPGKYEEFRFVPGNDKAVIGFMEGKDEVRSFLDHAFALIDQAVEDYLKRGFTHLTVNFGCTGGQHRSVFCAGKMAEHLKGIRGVVTSLVHREQENWVLK